MKSAALSRNRRAESGTDIARHSHRLEQRRRRARCAWLRRCRPAAVIAGMRGPGSALSANNDVFRSTVVMARHGFGRGEYKYFAYPLPQQVAALRAALYPPLARIANRWNERLGIPVRYPAKHADFLERCRKAGQAKPTPLLLQYGPGDYNCLHQDLYGEHVFPLQVAILLSAARSGFHGRGVRADRAAAPHAIACRGSPPYPGRGGDLSGASPPC